MVRIVIVVLLLSSCCPASSCAQEIIPTPLGKFAPPSIPGGGMQVSILNRTGTPQQIQVRQPGGNWYLFTIPADSGLNLRTAGNVQHFEAELPDDDNARTILTPGRTYELKRQGRDGALGLSAH